ncbi:MAG: DNA mismatch repair protein MutS [Ferruginibacter sp.]|nr:DNA mismatch repair protein MutS [Ferruginibacter sp.]
MEIDKTTLADLVIFDKEDEFSVFNKINLTTTSRGKEQLYFNLQNPLSNIESIKNIQQTILGIKSNKNNWPHIISNGTIMVVEKFFETQLDPIPSTPSTIQTLNYKILHSHDFSLVKYSVKHCFDFIKGMQQFVHIFLHADTPLPLKNELEKAQKILANPQLKVIEETKLAIDLLPTQMLQLAHFIKYNFKLNMQFLLQIFGKLDAWYGMALAAEKYNLVFPNFVESNLPFVEAKGLYHLMLKNPVSYNILLNQTTNFIFLTGANMAGKSTFIKACGIAVYLAHTGMGVPAQNMQLSFFDGILSNINVIDNIAKGESYFYNEVQRIKATVQKITNGKKWLILIDELFKGTNVQDAMKCSATVIEGLQKINTSAFILSTHLYEIGEELKKHKNISFNYFETAIDDDQLKFSYQLKEGISNDRLGYLILKKEGVLELLEKI